MAVTGGDLDSKIPKMPITINACVESELSMQSRSWNVTDSNKTIFYLIMTVQRNVPRYSMALGCGWNRFQPHIDRVQNRGTFLWTVISENIGA